MKKRVVIIVLLAVVLTLFAFPLTASAQNTWHVSKWTKYQGNPVLNPGSAGEWDDAYVHGPDVLHDGTTYHMWYSGDDGTTGRIGYATSPDGIKWTKYAGNPVLNPGSVGVWDDAGVYRPDVLYDGTTYHMWYDGCDGTSFRIGYATSPDGISWTKYAGNPVLNPGSAGEWDDAYVQSPTVLYDGTTYHMWYDGSNGTTNGIGYATSPDGINWTKCAGNPVLNPGSAGEWDDTFINRPDVLYDGTTYHMLYGGDDGSVTYSIGYASSTNGINWTKYDDPTTTTHPYAESDPVLNPGPSGEWDDTCIYSPGILHDGTTYHMWYSSVDGTNRRIGYATNSYIDADFLSIQNAIEYADPDDTILVHPGKYDENLVIGEKSLTLQSTDGWQDTTIDPPGDIIWIWGDADVTVQGFEITAGYRGIYITEFDSTANILDCFIHDNAADGIRVEGGGDLLHIEGNIISQNGASDGGCGISMTEAWSTVNILDNIIGGWTYYPGDYGDTGDPQRYYGNGGEGIYIGQVGETATVTIEDNKISENSRVVLVTGITIDDMHGVITIAGNDIGAWTDRYGASYLGNNDHGICIENVFSGAVLTIGPDNSIKQNTGHGIYIRLGQQDASIQIHHNVLDDNARLLDGCGIKLGSAGVFGAVVSDNTVTSHNWTGIYLDTSSGENTIRNNNISDNGHGIWIGGDDNQVLNNHIRNNKAKKSGIHLTSTAEGNVIHCNNIEGNLPYGVYNANNSTVVNATYNWWGDPSGPSHSPGSGDKVSDNVTYDPWLPTEFQYCPECGGTPPVPVGGEAYPINKAAILAPWIALIAAIVAGASLVVLRRRGL